MNKMIFDLDGTLANIEHRRHYVVGKNQDWDKFYLACDKDLPNVPIDDICRNMGLIYEIIIFSGRGEIARERTEEWLELFGIRYDKLYMRPIGDYTPDEELKKKWLSYFNKEEILCVFDDRQKVVDMWRSEGLVCLQVAKGDF